MTDTKTHIITCPECNEDWLFSCISEELARKVDASIHWVEHHTGPIPDDAPFGDYQCPSCHAILGLNGTVSCSECGHIPSKVLA